MDKINFLLIFVFICTTSAAIIQDLECSYCDDVTCPDAYIPDDSCCPVCPPDTRCEYEGSMYNDGETFIGECVTCTCTSGSMVCEDNGYCDTRCEYEGSMYNDGETFIGECVTCTCTSGSMVCEDNGYCDTRCEYEGSMYNDGETFIGECVTCTCTSGSMVCEDNGYCDTRCEYEGSMYNDGETFIGECVTCTCTSGSMVCEDNGYCDTRCEYKGSMYNDGETFIGECVTCTCTSGSMVCEDNGYCDPCANSICAAFTCDRTYTVQGQCCPVCDTRCEYEGSMYNDGETFTGECVTCTCTSGSMVCEDNGYCDTRCEYEGSMYYDGETFIGECVTCTCTSGSMVCVDNGYCDTRCEYEDNMYNDGETVIGECVTCTCTSGSMVCEDNGYCDPCAGEYCVKLDCVKQIKEDGECCPVCDRRCEDNGDIYNHGDTFEDECNMCTCADGVIACTDSGKCDPCAGADCAYLDCDVTYIPEGDCCPVCGTPSLPDRIIIDSLGDTNRLCMDVPDSLRMCFESFNGDPIDHNAAQISCLQKLLYELTPVESEVEPLTDEEQIEAFLNKMDKRMSKSGKVCTRKEYRDLTLEERIKFHNAMNAIYKDGTLGAFARVHGRAGMRAHSGPGFFPWHRAFISMLEQALQLKDPDVCLPFWDSTIDNAMDNPTNSKMWTDAYVGPGAGYVDSGPFAGWVSGSDKLQRNFGNPESRLMSDIDINNVLSKCYYKNISHHPETSFICNLEYLHGAVHVWVGGDMSSVSTAAYDPIFYLHHCFIDYIWEKFRYRQVTECNVDPTTDYNHEITAEGHKIKDNMFGMNFYLIEDGLAEWWTGGSNPWYRYYETPKCPDCNVDGDLYCDTEINKCASTSRIEEELKQLAPAPTTESQDELCTTKWCQERNITYKPWIKPMGWRARLPKRLAIEIHREQNMVPKKRLMPFHGPPSDGRTLQTAFQDAINAAFNGRSRSITFTKRFFVKG